MFAEPAPFVLLEEPAGGRPPPAEGTVRRRVVLPIRQEMLPLTADAACRPARLAGIIPLIHAIDDRLMAIYLRHAAQQHKQVFCREGCSTCCRRFLVLLSPAEMYYLMEQMPSLPPRRQRHARDWFAAVTEKAKRAGLIDRLRGLRPDDKPLDIVEQWWCGQADTACPFLDVETGACGIYPIRFVACREYCSHAPPEHCARRATARMPLPLNLFNVPWQLEQALSGQPRGAIELPLLDIWREILSGQADRTWPAPAMLDELFRILVETADQAQDLGGGDVVARP